MYHLKYKIGLIFFVFSAIQIWSQNDQIMMNVMSRIEDNMLEINQKIKYYNRSNDVLYSIYLHDWNHAFSDKNSNLGKRFLENYNNKFFFTTDKNRGYTDIHSFLANGESVIWKRESQAIDQIQVLLNKPLQKGDSVQFEIDYSIKLPNAKFTGYGYDKERFILKNWHLVPAVFDKGWQTMSHLDLDDLFQNPTDYEVLLIVPENYHITSNLETETIGKGFYKLEGQSVLSFDLEINAQNMYRDYQLDQLIVSTNLDSFELNEDLKTDILNRQLIFLKEHLGVFPHTKMMLSQSAYSKNPLYGFNQLPGFLRPFSDLFEWDLRMFQTLSKIYVDQSILTHTRHNAWLKEGLPHYLMMQYVAQNYPEKKMIGNISKIWGVKFYHLAEMNFNDRYLFAYQYVARHNQDQSLTVETDSLTNYNRVVANRFKTALTLDYLDDYLGNDIVNKSIKAYFDTHLKQVTNEDVFRKSIENLSQKELNWFFDDYIKTDKNLDFKINKIEKSKDSVRLKISGGLAPMPISVYGLKKKEIVHKYWIHQTDTLQWISFPNLTETKWMLNLEGNIPEVNLKNNWKNETSKLFNKPLKIRMLRDAEDFNHTQIFLDPKFYYNYYDGVSLATNLHNKTIFKKKFEYSITPVYGFKSNSLTGMYALKYWDYVEDKKINSFSAGIFGSYSHYKPELTYRTFSTYAQLYFKRKDMRSVAGETLTAFYTRVNKDIDVLSTLSEDSYNYGVFHLNYTFSNPAILNNFLLKTDIEYSNTFSKLYAEMKFRKLTNSNQQFEARLFTGIFLHNDTDSDYFSFGVNRPNDYLFRYNYYGRSEATGFFSQQFIMNDGGFKAEMPVKFANQWISSVNTSIGLWKWFEIYNDAGLVKNRNQPVFFVHENGIRFNFVNNFLEVYFPMYSNNGWEVSYPNYEQRIRFVITTNFNEIFSYFKRGVL